MTNCSFRFKYLVIIATLFNGREEFVKEIIQRWSLARKWKDNIKIYISGLQKETYIETRYFSILGS